MTNASTGNTNTPKGEGSSPPSLPLPQGGGQSNPADQPPKTKVLISDTELLKKERIDQLSFIMTHYGPKKDEELEELQLLADQDNPRSMARLEQMRNFNTRMP